jgi:hypothetical protein
MVDTVGNRLGNRKTFVYVTDSSVSYNISLDESVSTALGNDPSTNGSLPIIRASGKRPIEPRYVLLALQSDPSVKKKAIIGDYTNSLFLSSARSEVTINSVVWEVTTRVGEKRSNIPVDDAE